MTPADLTTVADQLTQLAATVTATESALADARERADTAEARLARLKQEQPQRSKRRADATLAVAAQALLDRLDTITTADFGRGGEKTEREALRRAIAELVGDPPPRPGDLPEIARRRMEPSTALDAANRVRNYLWHEQPIPPELLDLVLAGCESMAQQVGRYQRAWRWMWPSQRRLRFLGRSYARKVALARQGQGE